jgi:hypothetical protein
MEYSGPKKVKQQPVIDPGAEIAKEQSNDEPEPEDVIMIKVNWM